MKKLRKLLQKLVLLFYQENVQSLRATELLAWTEMQIASQMVEENFSIEQQKISELIVHHTRQTSHLIFSIEDILSEEIPSAHPLNESIQNTNNELKIVLRETRTTLHFLKSLFTINLEERKKRTIPGKIKEIEISQHSLENSFNSLKKIHKDTLHNLNQKIPWQNYIVSLLEELYRLQTTLGSMKNVLLQSRQGRYGPLLESSEILHQITKHQEKLQQEIESLDLRLSAATQNRRNLEEELQSIEQSDAFQEINNLQTLERDLLKQLEKIEDKLFIFFANLKDSLSDLADLNSDYELLEVIKEIEALQEEPLLYFELNSKERIMPLLNWILAKLTSEELLTHEDDQNPFQELYQELVSIEMKTMEEEFHMLFEQKNSLPRRKMQHPLFANAQNLRYKRDHYLTSEEKLKTEQRNLKDRSGHASTKAMQYKIRFEHLAKQHFNKEVEVELR